ncbi:MAG: hypothetical protein IKZ43_00120 [Acidaminococcaceae bacterium]|nr:hypothetical protein [Acidaminococcaceae bacterium]
MKIQELPARAYLAHLRRHPLPELMDEECVAALANVEAQFGDTITHGAGLEVRLGNPARYVDYIMNVDQDRIPGIQCIWYEIDYADFLRGGEISPCLFINTSDYKEEKADEQKCCAVGAEDTQGQEPFSTKDEVQKQGLPSAAAMGKKFWDTVLPPFAGEKRAARLRGQLNRVIALLPRDAAIKQIGTMSPRGELDILRLVVIFHRWDSIFAWLRDADWPGDTRAMEQALLPWKESQNFAVNIDLGESGLLEKTGLEVFGRWRHPLLVDKFIERLEEAGLCLPTKGAALRRWIRIRPDGDPFIQTLVSYFKLNYAKGRVTEAKAYLEQSPYIHHHYFEAYERPVRLDMELSDGAEVLPEETVLARIRECAENRVLAIRFCGGETYEPLERLLQVCAAAGIRAEVALVRQIAQNNKGVDRELNGKPRIGRSRLAAMIAAGVDSFLVDMENENDGSALWVLKTLQEQGCTNVRARWCMYKGNAGKLAAVAKAAEETGVQELIVTGMKPCGEEDGKTFPDCEQIAAAADFIKEYNGWTDSVEDYREGESREADLKQDTESVPESAGMKIVVESCFSPLRAYMEGPDPKRNGNRGIERGCEAGRSFMAMRADGSFVPCLYLKFSQTDLLCHTKPVAEINKLKDYWELSPELQTLRKNSETRQRCAGCCYVRRCLPCPACEAESGKRCPLAEKVQV